MTTTYRSPLEVYRNNANVAMEDAQAQTVAFAPSDTLGDPSSTTPTSKAAWGKDSWRWLLRMFGYTEPPPTPPIVLESPVAAPQPPVPPIVQLRPLSLPPIVFHAQRR